MNHQASAPPLYLMVRVRGLRGSLRLSLDQRDAFGVLWPSRAAPRIFTFRYSQVVDVERLFELALSLMGVTVAVTPPG